MPFCARSWHASMREVRSAVGMSPDVLREKLGDRRIIVWGGNGASFEVVAALAGRYGNAEGDVLCMQPIGFGAFSGFSAEVPDAYWATNTFDPVRHFVIIASVGFRRQIVAKLEAAGAVAGQDYLHERDLFRQRMVLRLLPGEAIDVEAVAGFLEREHAGLAGATLEIAGLPDPCRANGLEQLLARLDRLFPLTISTFVPRADLADLANRHGLRLRLVVYGDEALFRRHFQDRAAPMWGDVVDLMSRVDSDRPVELVRIGFPEGRAPSVPHLPNVIASTDIAYPNDFAPLLRFAEAPEAGDISALQALCGFDLPAVLAKVKAQRDRACMCERVYPVFRADGGIAVCHLHLEGTLVEDAGHTDLAAIVQRRGFNEYCRRCQAEGIHRFDLGLLR